MATSKVNAKQFARKKKILYAFTDDLSRDETEVVFMSDEGKVIGRGRIVSGLKGDKYSLWDMVKKCVALSDEEYFDLYKDSPIAYCYMVDELQKY